MIDLFSKIGRINIKIVKKKEHFIYQHINIGKTFKITSSLSLHDQHVLL